MAKRGCLGWTCAAVAALTLLAGMFAAGCGKSADSLYKEGWDLASKPETQARGEELLASFEERFPNDPRTPGVMLALATMYQGERKFTEAELEFTRLVEKHPDSPEACKGLFLLGYLYSEDMKDTGKAKAALERFITAYPDSELTASAKMLLENLGHPIEEWSTVRSIAAQEESAPESSKPSPAAK